MIITSILYVVLLIRRKDKIELTEQKLLAKKAKVSFEIFEHITIKSSIIFITAYDEFALKAFKFNSIDYFLKPIDEAELKNALEKYLTRSSLNLEMKDVLNHLYPKKQKNRFTIKFGNSFKMINYEDVTYFNSAFKCTFLTTNDDRKYPIDESLDVIEIELDPKLYFRISRQYIVHIAAIKEISIYSNFRLKIVLNQKMVEEIIVSREPLQDFKKWIN